MRTNWLITLGTTASLLCFQNCSQVNFSADSQPSASAAGGGSGTTSDDGGGPQTPIIQSNDVVGGHFDLDTSTHVYADGTGMTNMHVHEYDDKFKTNTADFFNLNGDKFDNVPQSHRRNRRHFEQRPGLHSNGMRARQ